MAFTLPPAASGSRRSRGVPPLSEINIIPLVDVVLVLLIIFMITAQVMEFGLEIEVPKVTETRSQIDELPVVSITKQGEYYLNDKPVNINLLGKEVRERFKGQNAVYVRADKATIWDPIAQVISALGREKLEVRMVTRPMEDSPGRR